MAGSLHAYASNTVEDRILPVRHSRTRPADGVRRPRVLSTDSEHSDVAERSIAAANGEGAESCGQKSGSSVAPK
jgi:hypothetical protein